MTISSISLHLVMVNKMIVTKCELMVMVNDLTVTKCMSIVTVNKNDRD